MSDENQVKRDQDDNDALCSRGAVIGANHTLEDAERDAMLPPQRIHWNISRNGKNGPSMEYVRKDIHESALATVRKEERKATFKSVRDRIEATNPNLTFGSANGSVMKKCILMEVADLEQKS